MSHARLCVRIPPFFKGIRCAIKTTNKPLLDTFARVRLAPSRPISLQHPSPYNTPHYNLAISLFVSRVVFFPSIAEGEQKGRAKVGANDRKYVLVHRSYVAAIKTTRCTIRSVFTGCTSGQRSFDNGPCPLSIVCTGVSEI